MYVHNVNGMVNINIWNGTWDHSNVPNNRLLFVWSTCNCCAKIKKTFPFVRFSVSLDRKNNNNNNNTDRPKTLIDFARTRALTQSAAGKTVVRTICSYTFCKRAGVFDWERASARKKFLSRRKQARARPRENTRRRVIRLFLPPFFPFMLFIFIYPRRVMTRTPIRVYIKYYVIRTTHPFLYHTRTFCRQCRGGIDRAIVLLRSLIYRSAQREPLRAIILSRRDVSVRVYGAILRTIIRNKNNGELQWKITRGRRNSTKGSFFTNRTEFQLIELITIFFLQSSQRLIRNLSQLT